MGWDLIPDCKLCITSHVYFSTISQESFHDGRFTRFHSNMKRRVVVLKQMSIRRLRVVTIKFVDASHYAKAVAR